MGISTLPPPTNDAPIDADYLVMTANSTLTNETAVGTNWTDLTDGGATTLHTHAGGSGWTPAITAQVAGYTAVKNDVVLCTGTFTVTLTAAATVATGGIIMVKNVSTGTIIVDGNAAETIDGALTITLAQYDSVMLITNGSNWFVI